MIEREIQYWKSGDKTWGGVYIKDDELHTSNRAATLISIHDMLGLQGLKNVRSRYDPGLHKHLIYGEKEKQ